MEPTLFKSKLLEKIFNFMMGFFAAFFIFLICLKIISTMWGAIIGIVGIFFLSYKGLKKYPKGSPKRTIVIGAISGGISIIVIYLAIWGLVVSLFKDIAN